MEEYILNGKTVKVAPEHVEAFVKANPSAQKKESSWWKGEEGWVPDELEFWKRKEDTPGKSEGASQPQENQQENTELSSEAGSSALLKYKLGDKFVKVEPKNAEIFEKENPDALAAGFPKGTILDKITDDKDEIPADRGFLADMVLSAKQGKRGLTADGAFDMMRKGDTMSEEDLEAWIKQVEKYGNIPKTYAQMEMEKMVEEEGGGIWGYVKSFAKEPVMSADWGAQMILQSLTTMGASAWGSEEVKGGIIAGGLAGGRTTRSKFGVIAGMYSGGIGAMETGLEFADLLKEELGEQGVDPNDFENGFTAENVRTLILQNPEALGRLKKKALARGMSMAAIEAMTFGLARGTGKLVIDSTMSKTKTALAVTGVEMVGGAGSEAVGQFASGGTAEEGGFSVQKGLENMDSGEIFIEGILEGPTAVFNSDIVFDKSKNRSYKINGGDVTRKRVVSILKDKDLTTKERAKILNEIEISNDDTLQGYVDKAINDLSIEINIDARVVDKADRKRLVELENKRIKAEQDAKKTGVFSVPDADKKLNDINTAIEEILSPYQNQIDSNLSDVQMMQEEAAEFNANMAERKFRSNLEFAKKHSKLYGLEVNDTLSREEIRQAYGDEAADADGWIDHDTGTIYINTEVAMFTEAVNVGNHELLHGILRQEMKKNPEAWVGVNSKLKDAIGSQFEVVEQRAKENYSDKYMMDNPDEWITLTSDAIANGDITYSESAFQPLVDLFLPLLRAAGFKQINFLDGDGNVSGEAVFEFLKEYNRSIHKGSLSSGIVEATVNEASGKRGDYKDDKDSRQFSKSNLDSLLDSYDGNARRMINQTLSKRKDGSPVPYREDKHGNYIGGIDSEFGQEIMPIVESITKRLFDPIPQNLADNAGVSRLSYQADLINEAATMITNEYNGRQSLDAFVSNRLNLRAQSLAKRLGIKSVEESSQETRINRGDSQLQIEDTTQPESSFETENILEKQAQESKGIFETKKKGEFVKKKLKFPDEVNNVVSQVMLDTSYDVDNKLYEDVKNDMFSQKNPSETSKNRVKPTGSLFPILEAVAENVFGVNPRAIMAKPQNLTNQESVSARTKIAEGMQRLGPKEYLKSILTPFNFNPKSGKSIGINTGLLKALYADSNLRIPNIKGKALNIENMSDVDILGVFGINPDYTLIPHQRRFDGPVKGIITQTAVFAANQEARLAAENQAAQIGVGKSDIMFSKSQKRGFYMSNKDLAKHWSEKTGIPIERIEKLIRINTKKNYKSTYDGIYNEETGETILEAKDRITREFLKEYPQFRDFLGRSGFGGRRRSTYGSINEFNEKYPETKNEKKLTRYKYLDKKKQQEDKINLTKEQQAIENKKLNELEAYFIAIQEFMKKNPESAMLFISFYQDGGSAGMGSMVRVSFPYKIYTVDQRTRKPNYKDNMREEHNHPANQIHSALLYAAMEGNVKRAFVGLRASIMQGSIKIDADNAINDGSKNIYGEKMKLKSAAPDIWFDEILPRIMSGDLKIEDGMGAVVRLAIQGVNLNELMIVGKNQTIAEHFGVGIDAKNMTDAQIEFAIPIQNHLIIKQMTGGITKRKATNIIKRVSNIVVKSGNKEIKVSLNNKKAVINTFQFSKSGKSKGMSTFDFDDTLAFTKSGVRVTMPNTDGKPKPRRKVIFLAGGAGSGKGNVVSKLGLEEQGFKIVNQDISLEWLKKNSGLPADMRDLNKEQRSTLGKLGHQARGIAKRKMLKFQGRGDGVVVDGTGASLKQMQKLVAEFEAKGYDVSMVFVETSLPVALDRNRARKERSLLDVIVRKNHEAVMNNKEAFKEIFGDRFMEVNTDTLTQKDQMPKELIDQMHDFVFSYEKRRLDAAEFAEQGDSILEEGGEFDFSEFNNVVDGTPGPLLQKARNRADKYGTQDMFVLTARPQASAKAIHEFLKSQGLNIPISNITGLGNSTGNAKAQWMLSKFAEGYNDIYFVDDAIQNVDAVKQVLDQLDIKSNVVQAKRQFSKSASQNFNTILEESQGTSRDRTFSAAEAKRAGKNKGWWRIFVPPSAEDFKGLLYRFLGTGRQGELHMEWFKIKLLDPFAKGIRAWNIYKQEMVNEYKQLRKDLPQVTDMLQSEVEGTGFTVDHAIRVYLWDKAGYDIPGLDQATKEELIEFVTGYVETQAFADILGKITKTNEGYVKPSNGWSIGSIATDLNNVVNKVGRKEFLAEYLHNVDMIFTAENINKIEALYGTEFKEALENILYRMENGGNRRMSTDRNVNRMYNWINGSIGAIMFFNMRSALLQTISTVNFINWHDNNIFKASAAFANQTQFWSDFAMLFNSPMLKQRRAGIQIDVSASELSRAFTEGKGTPQGVIDWLLEKGFTPTQIADSFAIAFGGASMYRNRLDTYLKQGYSQFEAHEKAMLDFQEVAEATQQSSREDLISQQQASPLGRLILAFQNVTMQYTRQMKKATSDLIHGRGDMKTNISKILYYGMVQNIVFGALQSALAMIMWGDDEEEIENRTTRTLNSALDSFLRGTGIYGAIVSTIKNTIIQAEKQKKKTWNREDGRTLLEIVNLSPPIGSKLRKIYNAIKTEQYNKGVSEELGLRIENPTLYKWASIVEALTNIPTQRLVKKANNLEEAITGNHEMWQRIFLGLGWNKWDLGVKDEELEAAKAEAKKNRKTRNQENKDKERKDKGLKQVRCSATKSNGKRCGMTTWTDKKSWTCVHHSDFKDGMDRDNDGIKEYRCTATKSNGRRCKNKTENTNKRCYAHQ